MHAHAPPATPLYRCFRLVSQPARTTGALRAERHTLTCQWNLVFRLSRASLFARLPLCCSAECATSTNTSLFANFPRNLANAPPPPESFRTCFVCTRIKMNIALRRKTLSPVRLVLEDSSKRSFMLFDLVYLQLGSII